jgi:hypothetical protein
MTRDLLRSVGGVLFVVGVAAAPITFIGLLLNALRLAFA